MNYGSQAVNRSVAWLFAIILILAGAGAGGRELFVAQQHAQASDQNDGAEATPVKTIQAGVNLAKAGDMVYVKEGLYGEIVTIKSRGTRRDPITLCAYKDDHVRLGCEPWAVPPKEQWTKIEGRRSWQVTLPEGTPDDAMVLIDGRMFVPELGPQPWVLSDEPPIEELIDWSEGLFPATTYSVKNRRLMINAGGKHPLDLHQLSLIRRFDGNIRIDVDAGNWVIRGLEFCHTWCGLVNFGENIVIEDCYFNHVLFRGIFGTGFIGAVRRCVFNRANLDGCSGIASVFEDNLFYKSGNCFKGAGLSNTFRYNFYDDSTFWVDGDGTGTRVYGNAFHDNKGYAIYNEYGDDDSLIIGNYMANTQAGVASSYCSRMSVLDNFIVGPCSGIILHNRGMYPMKHSFMTVRGNAIVGSAVGLSGYGGSYNFGPEGWNNCLVDYNRYRIKADGGILLDLDGKIRCKTIEAIRAKQGWEIHGELKPYDPEHNDLTPASLGGGTVTVRVPIGENGWKAREMLSDPGLNNKFPAAVRFMSSTLPAFFWRVADGDYSERPFRGNWPELRNLEGAWQAGCNSGYYEGEVCGSAWGIFADQPTKGPQMEDNAIIEQSDGNRFLQVKGKTPEKMLPQGVGFWTPVLPTAPEAKINVDFKIRGLNLDPLADKGGVAVWLRFTSMTGQQASRVFIVGPDDQGQPHNAKLAKGSYAWTEVKQTITAPKDAGRMALFLGLRPGKGFVHFDDIHINTDSGPMPESAKVQACLPPRLPLERFRATFHVDLSAVANRSLTDDEANNGLGGWSDQGPTADMRAVKTGLRRFGGVPFNILPNDKSLVVLKSSWRNPGQLPTAITIPVGRKADTLFFLHGTAYFGGGSVFKYIIHYEDGQDVTLTITSKNMTDWSSDPVKFFPTEEGTYTTAAETVPSPMFRQGSLYRMEWTSPADRRSTAIKSIEFASDGVCVPILLAITGVVEY